MPHLSVDQVVLIGSAHRLSHRLRFFRLEGKLDVLGLRPVDKVAGVAQGKHTGFPGQVALPFFLRQMHLLTQPLRIHSLLSQFFHLRLHGAHFLHFFDDVH